MKVIESSYDNDVRLKIKGQMNSFFGKIDLDIFGLQFVTIFHCKKRKKGNLKGEDLVNFENFSMFGNIKIRDKDYHYDINEMDEMFVTESEFSSEIQHHFEIEKSYFVNPKLLLANLDYLQKGKNFITKYPPPFIFENRIGKYVPIRITFSQNVKYARATETITTEKYTPSTYVWMITKEFCIPMISHCMIEGFGPKRGKLDPIKVIHSDKGKEKKTIIAIGLSLTNYLYFRGEEKEYSKFNNNYLLYELK